MRLRLLRISLLRRALRLHLRRALRLPLLGLLGLLGLLVGIRLVISRLLVRVGLVIPRLLIGVRILRVLLAPGRLLSWPHGQ
ncbi:hypothetical protein GCM10010246_26830 [Streptomyces cuspidosporus]|uniref:Uncharacterized protein n=1 Tax=Streptomyces cuspidosporus TaxID=66882 RepID=A0ABN3FYP0_9ACTN